MKILIFLTIFLPLINCAIIPEVDQNDYEYHQCLVSYLTKININVNFNASKSENTGIDCEKFHIEISGMINNFYDNVDNSIHEMLNNQTEADCLVNTFKAQKFLEIHVVLTAAYLSSNDNGVDHLEEVFEKSKMIFTIATMKCLMSDQMFMEIFHDFSAKLKVDDKEFECIRKKLSAENEINATTENANQLQVSATVENKEDFDYYTTETGRTSGEETTTTELITNINKIFKLSSEEFSSIKSEVLIGQSCEHILSNVDLRVTTFNFASLSSDQNACMAKEVSEKDIENIYEFIVMNRTSQKNETAARNEKLRELLIGAIGAVIDCADIFGFNDVIDLLLPQTFPK